MPVTWEPRGAVVVLSVSGLVTNWEIAIAIHEAIANAPRQGGMRLLWDGRKSQTPVSSPDIAWRFELLSSLAERGIFSRGALLLRTEQRQYFDLAQLEIGKALRPMEAQVFTDEAEALAWLER